MHRYPPELDEAIWSLMKAGCGSSEIKQRIDSGEFGVRVGKPIPLRTVQHKAALLRRSRGEPDLDLDADGLSVEDHAEIAMGEMLALVRYQARKIRAAAKSRSLTAEEARVLEILSRTIDRHRPSPKRRVGRSPGQAAAPTPKRLLAMLAQQSEGRSTPAADNGTS
jgi:hypothetical protein